MFQTFLIPQVQKRNKGVWHALSPHLSPSSLTRWIGGIALCSVVLIVVICNFLGLALGAYGLSVRDDPSDYESKGEAGATVLMV